MPVKTRFNMKNETNMELKTLQIPDGWEFFDVRDGKVILRSAKLRTWEECFRSLKVCDVMEREGAVVKKMLTQDVNGLHDNVVPDGLGQAMVAFCKLLICRTAWWERYNCKPGNKEGQMNYCVVKRDGDVRANISSSLCLPPLSFSDEVIRNEFVSAFKDLINKAIDLL